jgi:hypothetical protein
MFRDSWDTIRGKQSFGITSGTVTHHSPRRRLSLDLSSVPAVCLVWYNHVMLLSQGWTVLLMVPIFVVAWPHKVNQ